MQAVLDCWIASSCCCSIQAVSSSTEESQCDVIMYTLRRERTCFPAGTDFDSATGVTGPEHVGESRSFLNFNYKYDSEYYNIEG
jgi:hypothetical protein